MLSFLYGPTLTSIHDYRKNRESENRSVISYSLQPHRLYSPWNSPGQDTGVGSRSLLQGIFPTQGSNPVSHIACRFFTAEPPGKSCSIPGSGRPPGEGIGYPLQYSWASLVAQLAKNLPAMREIWVQSLVWEDLLEKRKATLSSILAWRIPWTVQSMGFQRVGHD